AGAERGLGRCGADELRVMAALSSHVAVAVENARLFEEERQSAETANALLRVSQTLTRCSDVEGVLDALVGSCADTFEGARVSAWMRERAGSFRGLAEAGWAVESGRDV